MYAVIESGGKQVRVREGEVVRLEKLGGQAGDEVVLDRVLLVSQGETVVGNPFVKGARVVGRIVEQGRFPKILVFKFKPKVRYRRRLGHRQPYTAVRIERIEVGR
ncbi:MAG: 50S ribosomal protein L21 [Armatimonadota bacterium]|nr:50S ribosomal protein L21 [Armatimonadota bacterium]MDR7438785.1 50S ribosomal protein L21 [Armatimonadota bacterium]MDR7562119.1 50S ribosomal protein L21 [Armatimonadota bacterium]MDR7568081.1 50S ribosomal protein L21 [Armatimonadota bacterium]MDR7602287.1 50S ribosomal protein L21 [Armatimonadota bacterium]